MESKYWGQEIEKKNYAQNNPYIVHEKDQPSPNTELSFGAGKGQYDFLVCYHREKPLNRFQIWMYKICFGIRARNF